MESVNLVSLTDVPYGNVSAVAGKIAQTTCSVPQTIAANGTYFLLVPRQRRGRRNQHGGHRRRDRRSQGSEKHQKRYDGTDDAVVTILDVKPALPQVDKRCRYRRGDGKEPGGDSATYTVAVNNPSPKEPLHADVARRRQVRSLRSTRP